MPKHHITSDNTAYKRTLHTHNIQTLRYTPTHTISIKSHTIKSEIQLIQKNQ